MHIFFRTVVAAVACIVLACAGTPRGEDVNWRLASDGALVHTASGIRFPNASGTLNRSEKNEYDKFGRDVSVAYVRDNPYLMVTVYLYASDLDGVLSTEEEFVGAMQAVQYRTPSAEIVESVREEYELAGAMRPVYRGILRWDDRGTPISSYVVLSSFGSNMLKVRATFGAENSERAEADAWLAIGGILDQLLAQEKLSPNANTGLYLFPEFHSRSGNAQSAWFGYGTALIHMSLNDDGPSQSSRFRSTFRESAFAQTLDIAKMFHGKRDDDRSARFRPTFEQEATARFKMARVWLANRDSQAAELDPYLEALALVAREGFIREYVWTYFREDEWVVEPENLALSQFEDWRSEHLKEHQVQTLLYVSPPRSTSN